MKIECLSEKLAQKVNLCSKATLNRGTMPILSTVKLVAKDGLLELTGANLFWSVNTTLGVEVLEEGTICIPAAVFNNFLSALGEGKITLETKNEILKVTSVSGEATFKGMPSVDYPEILSLKSTSGLSISANSLSKSLARVIQAAATDDSRPILTGVLFLKSSNELRLVGVDGFRLSESILVLDESEKSTEGLSVVIPAKTLHEILKTLSSVESVLLSYDSEGKQVAFTMNETIVTSRLLEGTFPNYQQIIPKEFVCRISINLPELKNAVNLASLFSESGSRVLKLKTDSANHRITLSANASDVGEAFVNVPAMIEGEDTSIAFNGKYLTDGLVMLGKDELVISIKDSMAPGLFQAVGDESFLHIIMPIRVQGE